MKHPPIDRLVQDGGSWDTFCIKEKERKNEATGEKKKRGQRREATDSEAESIAERKAGGWRREMRDLFISKERQKEKQKAR